MTEKANNDTKHLKDSYYLTKIAILRVLAFTYLIAFLVAALQNTALLGENGLTPAKPYFNQLHERYKTPWDGFLDKPTLFWWWEANDENIFVVACLGIVASVNPVVFFRPNNHAEISSLFFQLTSTRYDT